MAAETHTPCYISERRVFTEPTVTYSQLITNLPQNRYCLVPIKRCPKESSDNPDTLLSTRCSEWAMRRNLLKTASV